MHILLATKQKGESVQNYIKTFRNMSLHCSHSMSQRTLAEIFGTTFQIKCLAHVKAIETCT